MLCKSTIKDQRRNKSFFLPKSEKNFFNQRRNKSIRACIHQNKAKLTKNPNRRYSIFSKENYSFSILWEVFLVEGFFLWPRSFFLLLTLGMIHVWSRSKQSFRFWSSDLFEIRTTNLNNFQIQKTRFLSFHFHFISFLFNVRIITSLEVNLTALL